MIRYQAQIPNMVGAIIYFFLSAMTYFFLLAKNEITFVYAIMVIEIVWIEHKILDIGDDLLSARGGEIQTTQKHKIVFPFAQIYSMFEAS